STGIVPGSEGAAMISKLQDSHFLMLVWQPRGPALTRIFDPATLTTRPAGFTLTGSCGFFRGDVALLNDSPVPSYPVNNFGLVFLEERRILIPFSLSFGRGNYSAPCPATIVDPESNKSVEAPQALDGMTVLARLPGNR